MLRLAPLAAVAALTFAAPALAQPMAATPGGVDPAPGATKPFLGHPNGFYDPEQRLQDIDSRAATLPPGQRRQAQADIRRIHVFADTQKARHGGDLRDWDRERMTQMIDDLVAKYPVLHA